MDGAGRGGIDPSVRPLEPAMNKQHYVRLTADQRRDLKTVLAAGAAPARVQTRARVLLKADVARPGPRATDAAIAAMLEVSPRLVARTRATFATRGFAAALWRPQRRVAPPRRLDGAAEARLITLACSAPPAGFARWSLRLLAGEAVRLEIVDAICPETVRATLKKTCSSPG
jgi:hypothetical protein